MKKLAMLFLAAALTLCPLFALAAQETINVYNWGDYIEPEVLDLFEQETGIKVIYETFETNEDMYAKIAMGGSSYDVIIPSDYMIERMIQENLLQKINWENIPNVANIDPRFMNESYDPQSEYSVPYTWGTMGILYNTEMVEEAPTSWETLMDPTYTMDMLMLNSPRDTLAIALVMTGHDLNSTDPADLEDAKNLLIEQKPMVLAYVVDEVKDKMIAGEAAVAMVWSGDATFCMSENDELDYMIPPEGSNIFYDSIWHPGERPQRLRRGEVHRLPLPRRYRRDELRLRRLRHSEHRRNRHHRCGRIQRLPGQQPAAGSVGSLPGLQVSGRRYETL